MKDRLEIIADCASGLQCGAMQDLPVAYVELNRQGEITCANKKARLLYPQTMGEPVGRPIWESMPPTEQDSSCAAFFSLMQSGKGPAVVRRSLFDSTGEFRNYNVHRSIISDEVGKPVGMRVVAFDVTESTKELEATHRRSRWLESVLDSIAAGVILTDALGFIRYVNNAAEELTGWKAVELCGKVFESGLPLTSYNSIEEVPLDHRALIVRPWEGTVTLLDRQNRKVKLQLSASPIVNKLNCATTGVVSMIRKTEIEPLSG